MKTEPDDRLHNIVLTGFMGTGKTSVGHILAQRLGWCFVDTDMLIEQVAGRTISDIITHDGEAAFRQMEREACQQVASGREQVIATGGGAMLNPDNRVTLEKDGLLICLSCAPEEILRRLDSDGTRPLLADDPQARIRELLDARKATYDALPHHIDTTHRTPEEVAEEVLTLWQE